MPQLAGPPGGLPQANSTQERSWTQFRCAGVPLSCRASSRASPEHRWYPLLWMLKEAAHQSSTAHIFSQITFPCWQWGRRTPSPLPVPPSALCAHRWQWWVLTPFLKSAWWPFVKKLFGILNKKYDCKLFATERKILLMYPFKYFSFSLKQHSSGFLGLRGKKNNIWIAFYSSLLSGSGHITSALWALASK